ncbi:MAG: hypothetical protein K2X03_24630 [Bryobacteraceae bacterium]|nr:hypothetical protein [Bryobacteraceae bacterium]
MRTLFFAASLLTLAGCNRYADFTLPAAGGNAVDYRWQASEKPVLARSEAWDRVDALNPSVVRGSDGRLFNFYSGFDGKTWHTGLATSSDGLAWAKQGKVLSPDPGTWQGDYIAANGSALLVNGEYFYWYQAGAMGQTRIGLARSRDGRTWRKEAGPVLELGPRGAWDEVSLGDPDVIAVDGQYYLYYLGQDRARRQRLGVARSSDGVTWTKLRANPVLELGDLGRFDERGLGEPSVWRNDGYWMLYTGRDAREYRRMGLAYSRDGVSWRKLSSPVIAGEQEWNGKVVCDASVLVEEGKLRVWFGGGDVAHPAERLNGQIGYGELIRR